MLRKHHGYGENSVEGGGDSQPGAEVVGFGEVKGSSEKGFELNSEGRHGTKLLSFSKSGGHISYTSPPRASITLVCFNP